MSAIKSEKVKSISIVTAFFDIGRGSWSSENGYSSHLLRDNATYLSYFENLAKLDNEMVVFTTEQMKPQIEKLRLGKKTQVFTIDLESEFSDRLDSIKLILQSNKFINNIPEKHRKNPEYWSEKYILITNLKNYFVNKAIAQGNLSNSLVAWVDFGYCRDEHTLADIKNWYYPFEDNYIHLFTLEKYKLFNFLKNPRFPHNKQQVLSAIFNNKPYIIGGVIVANKETWKVCLDTFQDCQNKLMQQNIVDDDQGVYLMCHYNQPDLFKLNYLGKNKEGKPNWFGVMQKYHV